MKICISLVACLILTFVTGCTKEPSTTPTTSKSASSVDGTKYLLSEEPDGAKDVIKVRKDAGDGDDVVIVGRIGGGENPWVKGIAAFSIVDNSLKACSDIPGDNCEKPWDYCCETDKLPASTALVKIVNENGDIVKTDAPDLLNVKELSTVIIKGKAKRDESGNLTILAKGVYVKK